jgi:gliding motility-associated-like protein
VTQAAPAGTVITGNVTVTIMAMDMAGNAASCQFQVMLADTLPPSIACPANQTLSANADCEASLPDYAGMATLSDNCSALADIGLTQSPAAGTLISSTTTITLYAEDEEGNVDSCTFQVSIVDDSAPVLSACNSQTLSANADCEATLPDYRDSINVSDNCSATANIDLIQFPPAGSVIDDDTTVKIYAEDEAGNLDSCSFVVFFEDNASPTITCPSDIAKTTDPGSCSAVVTWPAPTVVDNCDDTPDFICMPPSGTTFPVGDSMVMCMAEDIAGNRDTCFFMVSVSDGENPFLECPPNDTIKVPAGVTSVVLTGISLFSIFDNCGVDTSYYHLTGDTNGGGNGIDASGETFNVGVTTIAYFATDAAGNTGTCSFTITIEAGQLVNLTCPANASAGTDTDLCTAVVNNLTPSATPAANLDTLFFQLSGAMLGSGANDASGTAFPVGTTTVTYIALSVTGDTSTCTVTVEVEDTQSPAFTNCPTAPIILSNTPDLCGLKYAGNILPVATDNCPGLVIDYLPSSGVLLPLGWSAVSAQATDAAGNTDICTFSIRVDDSQPPTISGCQNLAPGITMDTEPGKCGAVVNWTPPTATDNCQLIAFTVSQDSGTFFQAGLTPVEYVAVDSSGNVSKCVFNVTVNDTEKPTISPCPIDIGKSTDPGECFATVNWQTPVASDNCGVVSFNQTHQPGTTFDVGFHTVEYVATDAKGNMTKCTFNVQVADLEPPAINNLINSVVLYSVPDLCGNFVNWQLPTASDNCGLQSFMGTITPGSFFPVTPANNPHIVEYTALDIHGNANVKVFTVTMLDTIKPKLICPQNVTVSVDGGVISDPSGVITALQSVDCQKMKLEFSHPTATDACGISALTQSGGPIPGSTFTAGNNIITYLATDNNGNQRTCSYIIKVEGVAPLQASSSPASPCAGEPVILSVNQYPGATYTWKNPQGQVVSMASSFTLPGVTAAQAGSYTVEVKLPTCNLQGSVNLTVSPKPDVVATANSPLCSNGDATLNLTATDQAGVGVVQWIWNYPNNSIVNGQNQTIFNATSSNAGTYSVTAVTANGCSATATVQVEVSQHPVPAISGTSAAVCTGSQVVLNGQLFPGNSVTYHWSAEPMQGSGLTPIDNAIVNVTPSQPGDYTYSFYVVVDGCISDTAEWVINVQAPPSLVLAVDGDTKCVDGSTSVSLTETGGVATNWQWTGPNGFTSNEQNPTLQNIGIGTSGTYSVTSTTSNGCVSTASIPVAVTEQPAEAELFASSTAICDGASVTLTGTPYPAGAVYLWTGQNLPPFSQTKSTITVTPGQMGSFDYTFAAVVDGCTTNVVSVSILVENTPPVNITLDGSTECVNGTTSVTLKPNAPGANTYVWKGPNGTVISDQENLVLNNVTAANSGTYTLTASSFIGCQMSGSFSLTITDALPAVTALLVETPCEDGTLRLSTEPNIPGAVYEWKNSSGKIIANIQSPTLTGIIPALSGKYTVTVSKNGCTSTSEPLEVTILAYPVAQDETVLGLVNTPQSFNVVVNDDLQGEYSIKVMQNPMHGTVTYDGNGVFTYTPEKDFRENDQMIYQVCYEDCPGLCDVALVTILVRYPGDQCVITSVISPNNDGINDELIVSCLEVADHPLNKLIIFNQWGDKVYEAAPYKNDWQGTYNGKDLPDGTYFYIFQRDPDLPAAKGFVMIYR